MVSAKAGEGEIGILAGHEPVLSVLQPGEVRVFPVGGGQPKRWQVEGGFLSFDSNHLTIVVDDVVEGARPATPRRALRSPTTVSGRRRRARVCRSSSCSLAVVALWFSRVHTLDRRVGSFHCCGRPHAPTGPGPSGVAQYGADRLYWWRVPVAGARARAPAGSASGLTVVRAPRADGTPARSS